MIRLLDVHTLEFSTFENDTTPPYAAASHRWQDEETTYDDFHRGPTENTPGIRKIRSFCAYIVTHASDLRMHTDRSVDWLWIDTCCIDKRDSNELSEAINSMFDWYARADICLAYLYDVAFGQPVIESTWFDRGWTLQELLAPSLVIFLDKEWHFRGVKRDTASCDQRARVSDLELWTSPQYSRGLVLNSEISKRTGIPQTVLSDLSLIRNLHFNDILQWMAKRNTTKWEDRAYCLLGLMDVAMSPNYGEYEYAMVRLLNEIRDKYSKQIRVIQRTGRSQSSAKSVELMQEEINLMDDGVDMWLEQRAARRDQNRTRHGLPRQMQHEGPHIPGSGTSPLTPAIGGSDNAVNTETDPQTRDVSSNTDSFNTTLSHQFMAIQQESMWNHLRLRKIQAKWDPLKAMSKKDAIP